VLAIRRRSGLMIRPDTPDGDRQILTDGVFWNKCARTRGECRFRDALVVHGGHDDDFDVWHREGDLTAGFEPVAVRHVDVEHDDVRPEPIRRLDRRLAIDRTSNDFVIQRQQAFESGYKGGAVVGDENSSTRRWGHKPNLPLKGVGELSIQVRASRRRR